MNIQLARAALMYVNKYFGFTFTRSHSSILPNKNVAFIYENYVYTCKLCMYYFYLCTFSKKEVMIASQNSTLPFASINQLPENIGVFIIVST